MKKKKKIVRSDKKPATSRVKTEFYNPLSLSLSWFWGDVKFYSVDRGEKLIKQASDIGNGDVVLVLLPNVGNHLLLELGVLFDLASSYVQSQTFSKRRD